MFSKKRLFMFAIVLFAMVIGLFGCKQDEDASTNSEGKGNDESENELVKEDITLTIMMWDNWGQGFEENIKEPVEAAFPHITIENIGGDTGNSEWIEEALAAGIVPDIIFAHRQNHVPLLKEYELGFDMTDLIEKHDFDLSRYDPNHLNEWKSWTEGEVWLLPFMADRYALHYNKDIFDQFGVDYPTDGMTWKQVIDLASKVTGEQNGVQYQGLQIYSGAHLLLTQVMNTEQLIDPETEEVLWVDSPYVKEYLEMLERVNNIPGNQLPEGEDAWTESRTLAMRTQWLNLNTPADLNFDIVTFPQWEDAKNVGPLTGGWAFGITEPSKHKDDAMEVLKFLYSDDHITTFGDSPLHAPFNHLYTGDTDFEKDLTGKGEKLEMMIGKNLGALFALDSPGGPEFRSPYDVGAYNQIEWLQNTFNDSDLDVNSFLRELKEKEEIRIQNEKGME